MNKPRDPTLANLRRKRRYIHRQIDRYEPLLARLNAALVETEAAIQAIRPELMLHPRRYKPNPWFAKGELPRLALRILREAGEPLGVREVAVRALAAKGVPLPGPTALHHTRQGLHKLFVAFRARGLVRTVGVGREGRQELV